MKASQFFITTTALALAVLTFCNCKPSGESTGGPDKNKTEARQIKSGIVSAEKNSFDAVTSKLDKGGNFYLYLSTEQWLEGVSGKVGEAKQFVLNLPDIKEEDRPKIDKTFAVLEGVVKDSGIEKVSGVGMSSIAREPGLYYSKFILHHYKDQNAGVLWSVFGKAPHQLDGLDFLPQNTAIASFSDMDFRMLWAEVVKQTGALQMPELDKAMAQLPEAFAAKTGLKLDDVLTSLGGEYGLILTLDDSKKIALPLGEQGAQIPEPGLLIMVKVKDDTIFNRVDQLMSPNQGVIKVDKNGLKMRTMPLPLPLPIQLRPTIARSGDYLFLATTDTLVHEVLDVKNGSKPGWKSTAQFQRLAQGVPQDGNNFFLMTETLSTAMQDLQRASLSKNNQMTSSQIDTLQKLFGSDHPNFSFSVGANSDEGWSYVGNGSQSMNRAALLPAVAVGGLMAAIAVPNFVKARQTAQQNAIINNLRQLDGAKEQWALENKKQLGDEVTEKDIAPYLKGGKVTPVAGEEYILNPIGTPPKSQRILRPRLQEPGPIVPHEMPNKIRGCHRFRILRKRWWKVVSLRLIG